MKLEPALHSCHHATAECSGDVRPGCPCPGMLNDGVVDPEQLAEQGPVRLHLVNGVAYGLNQLLHLEHLGPELTPALVKDSSIHAVLLGLVPLLIQ